METSQTSRARYPSDRAGRWKSTNPFDSDFEDNDDAPNSEDDDDVFHDALEHDPLLHDVSRDVNDAFAVREFLSPLESALMQLNSCEPWSPSPVKKAELETSQADLRHATRQPHHYGSTSRKRSSHEPSASKPRDTLANPVLEELGGIQDKDSELTMDLQGPSSPWTKLLLLEELGTASSWALLLVPYVAFCTCLFLESYSGLSAHSVGPLTATIACPNNSSSGIIGSTGTSWLHISNKSCVSPFALQDFQQFGALRQHHEQRSQLDDGWAFVSGPIVDVPPMSVYLRGDGAFTSLSSGVVSAVAKGGVLYSTLVVQQVSEDVWLPVSISVPVPLTMECSADTGRSGSLTWNCVRPQIVDVLFSFPGTGILSGDDLRVIILFALESGPSRLLKYAEQYALGDDAFQVDQSYVYFDSRRSSIAFLEANQTNDGDEPIELLVESSAYTINHESSLYSRIDVWVRSLSLLITAAFAVFWCRALRIKDVPGDRKVKRTCRSIWCWGRKFEDELPLYRHVHTSTHFWWESPWIVFPERRYLLVMLMCLILLQNPLLTLAFFRRDLYKSPTFHAAADCVVGVGVFGILMILHCLFQGLRYHTAEVSRRQAKQQRQVLELRRAAKYLVKPGSVDIHEAEASFIAEHYEAFGSGFSAFDTRLRHDPVGHDWPDFLLPKLILLLVGVIAVLVASVYRFSVASTTHLSFRELRHYNMVYISSSFVQLSVAFFWMILIVRQTSRTAWMLRKEPFLSTRPAQLSFRILLGMLFLGLLALVVPILLDVCSFLGKWAVQDETEPTRDMVYDDATASSSVELLLEILAKVSQHFPYSGTAANIGPGKIIYATACTLVASIIFLPSRSSTEDGVEDAKKRTQPTGTQGMFAAPSMIERKRDKRLVVTLARYTRTWRVFPLPIQKVSLSSSLLAEMSFQVDSGERSVAHFGKYTPVFCLELACWLLEASWQAYYSPQDFSTDEYGPDRMALESIGLKLEKCVLDESTDSQVYIASNSNPQVDGYEDSIVVVGFRGTVSMRNMALDLKLNQVPLLDQIIGLDFPMFEISSDGIDMNDSGDWFWDSPYTRTAVLKSFTPKHSTGCFSFTCHQERKQGVGVALSQGAKAVLAATPVTRQTLPCVHQGFLEAYSHIRKQVLEGVMEVMQRQLSKAISRSKEGAPFVLPKVYITGHSLGGSVGQLFALDLASNVELIAPMKPTTDITTGMETLKPASFDTPRNASATTTDLFYSPFDDMKRFHRSNTAPAPSSKDNKPLKLQPAIAVYTYGQPRVGNHTFSRLYKQKVPHTFRVVNEGDALTTMPNAVLLGGQYKHAGLEVMLDEGCTGNILVGPTIVETMFRFGKVRTSLAAHSLDRYRENLESGLAQDELHEYYRGHGIQKSPSDQVSGSIPDWLTQVKRSNNESY